MEHNDDGLKEVYFDKYCALCQHKDKKETEDPCWDCLKEPANLNSHKPVKWMESFTKRRSKEN